MVQEQQEQPEKPSGSSRKGKQGRASVEMVRVRKWVKVPKKKLTPAMQQRVLEKKEKQKRALEARKGGATYAEIGRILGISTSYARDLVIEAANQAIDADAKEVIMMDLLRLDEFQMRATAAFRAGDLNQIERIMRIMRERRDILGLTTDSWKEEQAQQAAGSITNNGIMVVQGNTSDFVRSAMLAVGVDPNSPEAQARLKRIKEEEEREGKGEYALKPQRPNELLMSAADSALNRKEADIIQGEVVSIKEEEI